MRVLTVWGVKVILVTGVKESTITGIIYCTCIIRNWCSERCKACGLVIACPNPTYPQRNNCKESSKAIRAKTSQTRKGVCGKISTLRRKTYRQSHFLIIHLEISSECDIAEFQLGPFMACRTSCGFQKMLDPQVFHTSKPPSDNML